MEQEDREQTELLTKISDEIIDLSKTNHKYETEIRELDATKWVDVIEEERNKEKETKVNLEEIKSKLARNTQEIDSLNKKAGDLEKEISSNKEEFDKEQVKLKEERNILEKELETVTHDLEKENEKIENDEKIIADIETELEDLGTRLERQKDEVDELEKELREVNIEEFNLSPKEPRKFRKPDTGEGMSCLNVYDIQLLSTEALLIYFLISALTRL